MLYAILIVLLALALWKWFNNHLQATILAAWIVEKNIAPPEQEDVERLSEWVVQKWFKKH